MLLPRPGHGDDAGKREPSRLHPGKQQVQRVEEHERGLHHHRPRFGDDAVGEPVRRGQVFLVVYRERVRDAQRVIHRRRFAALGGHVKAKVQPAARRGRWETGWVSWERVRAPAARRGERRAEGTLNGRGGGGARQRVRQAGITCGCACACPREVCGRGETRRGRSKSLVHREFCAQLCEQGLCARAHSHAHIARVTREAINIWMQRRYKRRVTIKVSARGDSVPTLPWITSNRPPDVVF